MAEIRERERHLSRRNVVPAGLWLHRVYVERASDLSASLEPRSLDDALRTVRKSPRIVVKHTSKPSEFRMQELQAERHPERLPLRVPLKADENRAIRTIPTAGTWFGPEAVKTLVPKTRL